MQPGGYSGYDKGLSVLEQYDLTSENTHRGRGALLCQTQQGLKMIRPYNGPAGRLEKVYELLEHLKEAGHKNIDQILRNKEGNLISTDKDGISYIVKDWWDLRECDARSGNDVIKAVRELASVHKDMYINIVSELPYKEDCMSKNQHTFQCNQDKNQEKTLMKFMETNYGDEQSDIQEKNVSCEEYFIQKNCQENQAPDLREIYRKHNQELKKIREFIRKRKQKNQFEYLYLEHVPRYLIYGEEVLRRLEKCAYEKMRYEDFQKGSVCHNGCTQHNFLMGKSGAILVNYEHYCFDSHMADLAQFMRKILEKHGWNRSLAEKIIHAYDQMRSLSQAELEQLQIRLSYPEKFWKISNNYYNNNKAFFPERTVEKLIHQMENERNWLEFIQHFQYN